MKYKFTQTKENYEVYASGHILYAGFKYPVFPIRLANEIFRRCLAHLNSQEVNSRCVIYDPCCGGAYMLATLAYFNWTKIEGIYGSDIDNEAISLALRNASLLKVDGLENRIKELKRMYGEFGKSSHLTSLNHALDLKQTIAELSEKHPIETCIFQADATDKMSIQKGLGEVKIDIVMTDLPYGHKSNWNPGSLALKSASDPVYQLLESLYDNLHLQSVVAITSSEKQKITHEKFKSVERFKIGKRNVILLKRIS